MPDGRPPGEHRAALEARNAAMKDQVDRLLDGVTRQTERLQQAQADASRVTATLTSKDGLATVTVNSAGVLTELEFSQNAFERSRPESLARTVQALVQQATVQVKRQVTELMAPMTTGLPDLSDLFEGAPSLGALIPKFPELEPEGEDGQQDAPLTKGQG
ncbi:YbaB/EbfC family nucleoid-associated protein [Amycolatopsis minnesotensis]|uniref:YbaB/EbfC family nucleoid-associated protein n=1 Tax=Amycolatopsis minnesotensis TaxID=337894 RepID=UPI0031E1E6E7